jgi:GxxExxY protein
MPINKALIKIKGEMSDLQKIHALSEEIFAVLGAGHTESVYHNAMKIGIQDLGLQFETERDLPITFRGRYVGTVRADLIIEKRLVIELKACHGADAVVSDAEEQCRLYMKETHILSGIVVIFPKRVGGKLVIKKIE